MVVQMEIVAWGRTHRNEGENKRNEKLKRPERKVETELGREGKKANRKARPRSQVTGDVERLLLAHEVAPARPGAAGHAVEAQRA